jgi:hypothetical protein
MENIEYELKWYIENEVLILTQFHGEGIEQAIAMMSEANGLIDSSPNEKVPVIIDVSKIMTPQKDMNAVIQKFRTGRSKKWGFTVVIGAEGIIKFFAQLFFQFSGIEVRLAKNMDEALEILYRVNPNLPRLTDD